MIGGNGFRLGLLAAIAVAPFTSQAATVSACGPNVCYEWDNAQAAIALTGNPSIVGDSAVFLPPSFIAHSNNNGPGDGISSGFVTTTANFIFSRIYTVNPGNEVTALNVHEEFDYEIIAPPVDATPANVRATLYAQAASNVLGTDHISDTQTFGPVFGDTGGNQIGTLDVLLDPANQFVAIANDMQVTIQNTLRAYTDSTPNPDDQDAFIQKKFTLVTETLIPVPVPGAIWLLGSAVGLLGWMRRRGSSI